VRPGSTATRRGDVMAGEDRSAPAASQAPREPVAAVTR
jgi:hypothetical protein